MQSITISGIQSDLFWEDRASNLDLFDKKIDAINSQTDLIVLPEMFTTGFTMNTDLAETMEGVTVSWMTNKAIAKKSCIMGSLIIKEGNQFYNRMVIALSSGEVIHYDKRHLFSFAGEDNHYSSGQEKITFTIKGWKICPLICYDLRFPVWSRNDHDIDLYIYVANWPKIRVNAWTTLLEARAIENVSYVLGINRVGTDGTGKEYSGNSGLIDFKGQLISDYPMYENHTETKTLTKEDLIEFRTKFPALKDADNFKLL